MICSTASVILKVARSSSELGVTECSTCIDICVQTAALSDFQLTAAASSDLLGQIEC